MLSEASPEPLSPELVLVLPPEEAQLARDRLPRNRESDWDEFLARIRSESPLSEHGPVAGEPAPSRSRRSRRKLGAVALVVGVVATVAGIAWARDHGEHPTAGPTAPTRVAKPARPKPARPKPVRPKAVAPKPKRSTVTTARPRKPHAVRTKPARPRTAPGSATSSFVPSRVWSWAAARGSTRYLVRFFRNGQQVLAARTTTPRLVLAKQFRFRAGRYRWTVVAISGRSKARRLVDSTFVLSAAAAARANSGSPAGR
jgi:hypothetical protein